MKNSIKKFMLFTAVIGLTFSSIGCSTAAPDKGKDTTPKAPIEVSFRFDKDKAGWDGGFVDLPVDYDKSAYELEFSYKDIPMTNKTDKGLFLRGQNRSDDLFMFITKKLNEETGLKPNASYKAELSFDLATNVASGMMGIGGSPGTGVIVKAGIVNTEPKILEGDHNSSKFYLLNIDIGNQTEPGKDLTVLGNVEKVDSEDESYQYKSFRHSFDITTNENGECFVVIGTDSGFEGLTQLYYTNIKLVFAEK
jgi:hypothetical protein